MKGIMTKELRDHPQKYTLKKICRLLYCFGLGNFWYKTIPRTKFHIRIYALWALVSNIYTFSLILNEMLAYMRKGLTEEEKSDLILFTFGHTSIASKILAIYFKRDEIKTVLQMLIEEKIAAYKRSTLDEYYVKRAKLFCTFLFININIILISASIEGIKRYLDEGHPIRTEVTYLPTPDSSGMLVNIFRFLTQLHWWFILTIMYFIDCLSICSLVFLSYKFKKVRLHYENSRHNMKKGFGKKTLDCMDMSFKRNFVTGIRLHQNALLCARKIQNALGSLYSIQVAESIALLVVCLLKLTIFERNIASVLKNGTFISCVLLLNSAYMIAGGDVTHEASLIANSVFHCGWEYAKARKSLRSLIVVTIQRSQVPIRMTAFGVLSLSYNSFITVLRLTYSFFAVMY